MTCGNCKHWKGTAGSWQGDCALNVFTYPDANMSCKSYEAIVVAASPQMSPVPNQGSKYAMPYTLSSVKYTASPCPNCKKYNVWAECLNGTQVSWYTCRDCNHKWN